jgi:anti-sigma regulatory factor (Ser/Thr protein kinase)
MTDLVPDTGSIRNSAISSGSQRSAESLITIINDILDFSKIEAGMLRIERVPCDLREIIDGAIQSCGLRAAEKQLRLRQSVAAVVPPLIVSDQVRLRQILLNLLGNAVKFTEAGEVAIEVACASESGQRVLQVAVRDTGIGIAADQLDHIFNAFSQGDSSTTRRFGGTGLGLSITRRLVELLGGRLGVRANRVEQLFHFSCRRRGRGEAAAPAASRRRARPGSGFIRRQTGAPVLPVSLVDVTRSIRKCQMFCPEPGVSRATGGKWPGGARSLCPRRFRPFDGHADAGDGRLEASREYDKWMRGARWSERRYRDTANAMEGDPERCWRPDGRLLAKPIRAKTV